MRIARNQKVLVVAICALFSGCGSNSSSGVASPLFGPHGGPAVPLPDDLGVGEILLEDDSTARKGAPQRVAVYFLQKDMKAPLAAPPKAASVKLSQPGGGATDLTLAPQPNAKDPLGSARFASPPVTDPTDPLIGELTVTIGDRTATMPFSSR